jgi:SH3-like domain-containing protein
MRIIRRFIFGLAALAMLLGTLPVAMADKQVLYTAKTVSNCTLRAEANREAKIISGIKQGDTIEIYEVGPEWVTASYKEKTGYILRSRITAVTPVDPVNTPPYGVFKHNFIAVAAVATPVLFAPQADAQMYVTLQAGAKLSILDITDGWARIPYKRAYAYADTRLLKNQTPVSPTDEPLSSETPIAAFTSFYSVADTKSNIGRMENIRVACQKLSRVFAPGEELNFNTQIGPFSKANGYVDAPVLVNGDLSLGPGGGTCQVSSTFYNTILQLPKITVLYRRPHGPTGAKYLPHGMDAAVGTDNRNLRIRNDYDFAIRVEASSQDGALFMCIYKQ